MLMSGKQQIRSLGFSVVVSVIVWEIIEHCLLLVEVLYNRKHTQEINQGDQVKKMGCGKFLLCFYCYATHHKQIHVVLKNITY